MDEFELIDRLIEILGESARGPAILLGPGDDSALIRMPANSVVVSSIDTLVADVHFPGAAPADLVGFRSLGVSISDLAAMGAEPDYALIALTLPDGSAEWLERFAHGVAAAATRFGVKIAGGNIARGPLNISVSVHGHCAANEAIARSGVRERDLVCVSGVLGGAAAALERSDLATPPGFATLLAATESDQHYQLRRYYLPEPRIALGRALRGIATAAIDVSDGLVADLGHLCAASHVAGVIDLDSVPLAPGSTAAQAASGGDDYELCFTIAPEDRARLSGLPERVSVIGRIEAGNGVSVQSSGRAVVLQGRGFRHFR